MNAIVRGDLRARFLSPKAQTIYTIFLGVLGATTVLSLPPELGRLDEIRGESLLLTILLLETVAIGYLTAAFATGEIAIEGEKSVEDLASAPFSARDIGVGKIVSVLCFAGVLVAAAAPVILVVVGVQGEPLVTMSRAGVVALLFGGVTGALGTLASALVESDVLRSLLHWLTLLALVAGGAALPEPWNVISPIVAIPRVVHNAGSLPVILAAVGAVVIMLIAAVATSARVMVIRAHAFH